MRPADPDRFFVVLDRDTGGNRNRNQPYYGYSLRTHRINGPMYCFDRATGKLEWEHKFNNPDEGPNGVSYGYGRLYGATSTDAFALDPATGKQIWARKLPRKEEQKQ